MNAPAKITDKQQSHRQKHSLDYLKSIKLFCNLSSEELAVFNNAARSITRQRGKTLYLQGDSAENFYIILGGWIKLFHTLPGGEEVVVDMLTTGQIVGESALFDHGCYTSSAEVVESASLLSIPLKILKEQIHLNPKLAFNMLTSMSQHHRRHYGAIALGAFQNAPQRIGCFILSLCSDNKDKDIVLDLPFDKTLLSDTLHMKGATFSRALVILRQKTGIRIRGSRIEIDFIEPLIKFVYGIDTAKYLLKKDAHSFPME